MQEVADDLQIKTRSVANSISCNISFKFLIALAVESTPS